MKNLNNGYTLVKSMNKSLIITSSDLQETELSYIDVLEYAATDLISDTDGTYLVETSLIKYGDDNNNHYYVIGAMDSDRFKSNNYADNLDYFINNPTYTTELQDILEIYDNLDQATKRYNKIIIAEKIDIALELFKQQDNWEKSVYIIDGIYENSKDDSINVLDSFSEKNTDHLYNWLEGIYNTLTKVDSKIFTESEIVSLILDEMLDDEKESYKIKESEYFENEERAEKDGYFWNESLEKWIKLDFNTYL